MRQLNLLLIIISLILIALNFYAITFLDLSTSRWIRLLSLGIFLSFFLKTVSVKNWTFVSAVSLFLISDVCHIYYETLFFGRFFFITGILGYLLLILHIIPELKDFKSSFFQKIMFALVFAFDIVILIMLADMIPNKFGDSVLLFLFLVYGLTIILLKIVAVLFSNRSANKASFFFVCAVLGLVFSDVTLFISYYIELPEFYYPCVVFYMLGLASLVKFSSVDKEEGSMLIFEE